MRAVSRSCCQGRVLDLPDCMSDRFLLPTPVPSHSNALTGFAVSSHSLLQQRSVPCGRQGTDQGVEPGVDQDTVLICTAKTSLGYAMPPKLVRPCNKGTLQIGV